MRIKEMMTRTKETVSTKVQGVKGKLNELKNKTLARLAVIGVITIAVIVAVIGTKISDGIHDGSEAVTHQVEVTNVTIEHKLQEIGEMATYEYTYTDMTTIKDTRRLFDKVDIPGTTHSMDMKYSGVIKVGYEVANIQVKMNGNKIKIELPEAQVLDNYINDEDVEFLNENNNPFNPIEPEEGYKYLPEEKQRQLEMAEEEGIYDLAEENAKKTITELLSGYEDYEVEFI